MKISFWGVRGSYPIARRDNIRYGGSSTCIQIDARNEVPLIMDGGSGIRALGEHLIEAGFGNGGASGNILVGHTHWDHILGYPFFEPLYRSGNRFTFYSAGHPEVALPLILAGQHQELHFPVPFEALTAELEFKRISPGSRFRIGGIEVRCMQLNHPGITLGYRLEHGGKSVVICTDTARIEAVQQGEGMPNDVAKHGRNRVVSDYARRLVAFVDKVDVLIHDSHFLEEEIAGKEHWGHSTAMDALELAVNGRVKHLVLFHHAPEHDDETVDRKLAYTREAARASGTKVTAAREGFTLDLADEETC